MRNMTIDKTPEQERSIWRHRREEGFYLIRLALPARTEWYIRAGSSTPAWPDGQGYPPDRTSSSVVRAGNRSFLNSRSRFPARAERCMFGWAVPVGAFGRGFLAGLQDRPVSLMFTGFFVCVPNMFRTTRSLIFLIPLKICTIIYIRPMTRFGQRVTGW